MTTDHLTREQRDASTLFLEGAGWGFGGAVEPDGRYGWIGGTGTTGHVVPSTGTVGVLFTQVSDDGPDADAAHARVLAVRVRCFGVAAR